MRQTGVARLGARVLQSSMPPAVCKAKRGPPAFKMGHLALLHRWHILYPCVTFCVELPCCVWP